VPWYVKMICPHGRPKLVDAEGFQRGGVLPDTCCGGEQAYEPAPPAPELAQRDPIPLTRKELRKLRRDLRGL
jgi:hypothetical protein